MNRSNLLVKLVGSWGLVVGLVACGGEYDETLAEEAAAASPTYDTMAPSPDRWTTAPCHVHGRYKTNIEVFSCFR